jgi:hypothetical protein
MYSENLFEDFDNDLDYGLWFESENQHTF